MMPRVTIADGIARAVIRPDLGAGLERYELLSPAVPLFDSAPRSGPAPFRLACNLLLPWSGRISGGGFSFGGRFHALAPNLEGEPCPIHGNGFESVWTVQHAGTGSVRLNLESDGPGPYRYAATVRYALGAGPLTMALSITNRAAVALPYGLGFPPVVPTHAADHAALRGAHRVVRGCAAFARWFGGCGGASGMGFFDTADAAGRLVARLVQRVGRGGHDRLAGARIGAGCEHAGAAGVLRALLTERGERVLLLRTG